MPSMQTSNFIADKVCKILLDAGFVNSTQVLCNKEYDLWFLDFKDLHADAWEDGKEDFCHIEIYKGGGSTDAFSVEDLFELLNEEQIEFFLYNLNLFV